MYALVIIENKTHKIIKIVGQRENKEDLYRAEMGVLINLNHDEFHTEIIPSEEAEAIK